MEDHLELDKITYVLKNIYENSLDRKWMLDLIIYSKFEFKKHWNTTLPSGFRAFNLTIHTDHEVYTRLFSNISNIGGIILRDINTLSEIAIGEVQIFPDYAKLSIINSEIRPVYTKWEEINISQQKLLDLLKISADSFDFQNIGNTSRTVLQKISNIVFNPAKHSPLDKSIDCSPGKFKNKLQSYIKVELLRDSNKELRKFAEAAIVTVEKAIDLANSVTHKLEAERVIAEVCVISTISAVSIIKLIETKK